MNRRNKGFTLVELQIASAIALIVLSAVLSLYLFSWRSFTKGNTFLDVYSNSRIASEWLIRDIRCAAQVVEQYPETGTATYQTDDHVIVLKVPSIHEDTQEIISSYYDYIVYYLSESGDLMRIVRIDQGFKNAEDPYYAKSYRKDDANPVVITRHCEELTFSSGGITLSDIENLSVINTISIYLPINKSTTSVNVAGMQTALINPTTVIRLRNK